MQPLVDMAPALGGAILCFAWQGVLIGLGCALLLGLTPQRLADRRYAIACGALMVSLLSFLVSLLWLAQGFAFPGASDPDEMAAGASFLATPLGDHASFFGTLMHSAETTTVLAWLWSAGVAVMILRLLRSWGTSHRLRSSARADVPQVWQAYFEHLRDELGISAGVRLLQTTLVTAPMVVGFLSPVVLVPLSVFSSLSSEQLRLLLRHELAHIHRFDHLVNMAQCAVEALLFFHPATWWISSQIRREREFCCDQAAVATPSDRRHLAEALTELEQVRLSNTSTILSAHGGPLMIRILRILNAPLGQTPNLLPGRSLGLVAGAAALVVGSFAQTSFSAQDSDVQKDPVVAESSSLDGAESISQETYEKLTKAVKEKVKAGEMTPEKAHEIEVRLRERLSSSERPPSPTAEEVKKAADKLDKLVAAGEITRAAADRRLRGMKLALEKASAPETGAISEEEFQKSSVDIKLLLRSGKLTREDVKKAAATLDKLVAAGEITRAAADRRIGRMKLALEKASARETSSISGEEFRKSSIEIKLLVRSGNLTQEEAAAKILALSKLVRTEGGEESQGEKGKESSRKRGND
jgi:bla regulator protein blaR1